MRRCPLCHGEMVPITYGDGLAMASCLGCRGLWLSRDMLSRAVASSGGIPDALLGEAEHGRDRLRCPRCGVLTARSGRRCESCEAAFSFPCPDCGTELVEESLGKVQIDRCPTCQGVWLDAGEIALLYHGFQRAREEGDDAWMAYGLTEAALSAPDLVFLTGHAVAEGASHLPEAAAGLAQGAAEGLSHAPEAAAAAFDGASGLAEGAFDGASSLAEGAFDGASGLAEGAFEGAGEVAEAAGGALETFFEFLGDILSGLFD